MQLDSIINIKDFPHNQRATFVKIKHFANRAYIFRQAVQAHMDIF